MTKTSADNLPVSSAPTDEIRYRPLENLPCNPRVFKAVYMDDWVVLSSKTIFKLLIISTERGILRSEKIALFLGTKTHFHLTLF